MARITHIETFGATFSGQIHMFDDLVFGFAEGTLVLHGVSRTGNAMVAWSLEDGGTNYRDRQELPEGGIALGEMKLSKLTFDGADHLTALAGSAAGLAGFAIGTVGRLDETPMAVTGAGLLGAISAFETLPQGGVDYVYSVQLGTARIQMSEIGAGGALIDRASTAVPQGGLDISDLSVVAIGSGNIMLATSAWSDRIYSFGIAGNGALVAADSIGAAEGLGIDAPTAVETFVLDGEAYAVIGSAGSNSLSVLSVAPNGAIEAVSHIVDDRYTRFENVTGLAVATGEGRVFVAAGGSDHGITLFEALAGGRLLLIGSVADELDTALQSVATVALQYDAGVLHIAIGSATEGGVTRFAMDVPSDSEQVLDTGGDDTVRGGAGDDIIFAGMGEDDVSGGDGFDVFVMSGDGKPDTIRDFEVGIDKIDLSGWDGLKGIDQLRLAITGNGGRIFYGDEVLSIFPNPRAPLTFEEIKEALSLTFHAAPVASIFAGDDGTWVAVETESGADAGESVGSVRGGTGETDGGTDGGDTGGGGGGASGSSGGGVIGEGVILGQAGPDSITGGVGADLIYGIAGNDTLAGAAGDDLLDGGTGNDVLSGQSGNDTIYGQDGTDTINGGAGADLLIGGPGGDTIVVDHAGDNVVESRSWDGTDLVIASVDFRMGRDHIENLELRGTAILGAGNGLTNDIRGNNEDNILDGGKNNDTLTGGAGNDTYLVRAPGDLVVEAKGSGDADVVKAFRAYELTANVERLYLQTLRNDAGQGIAGVNGIGNALDNLIVGNPFDNVIVGREGSDTLRGQAGADTFVFDRRISAQNIDRIMDFNTNTANEGDRIAIKQSIVSDSGLRTGPLAAGHLAFGTRALDGNDRFVFDAATGRLWYDADGVGGQAQRLMATFEQDAQLSGSDIFLV